MDALERMQLRLASLAISLPPADAVKAAQAVLADGLRSAMDVKS
jgi:hypothetical protein